MVYDSRVMDEVSGAKIENSTDLKHLFNNVKKQSVLALGRERHTANLKEAANFYRQIFHTIGTYAKNLATHDCPPDEKLRYTEIGDEIKECHAIQLKTL